MILSEPIYSGYLSRSRYSNTIITQLNSKSMSAIDQYSNIYEIPHLIAQDTLDIPI